MALDDELWGMWRLVLLLTGLVMLRVFYPRAPKWVIIPWRIGIVGGLLVAGTILVPGGIFGLDLWPSVGKLLPLLCLTVGLTVVLRRRSNAIRWGYPGVVLAVGGSAILIYSALTSPGGTTGYVRYNFPLGNTQSAILELELGLDHVTTGRAEDPDQLVVADLVSEMDRNVASNWIGSSRYDPTIEWDGHTVTVRMRHSKDPELATSLVGENERRWRLGLNTNVPFEIVVNGGVGASTLDLTGLIIRRLEVNGGIGEIKVIFPYRDGLLEVVVYGGVGDIEMRVPRGVGASIVIDRGIGDIAINSRFSRMAEGTYESEDYRSSTSRLQIRVDVGFGDVIIH